MKQISQISRTAGKRGRIGAAAALGILLLALSACGFNVQTLQPYQPSDGVDIYVGAGPNGKPVSSTIKVGGLMIIAKTPTSGFLSATLNAQDDDSLTSVTGNVLKPDGSTGDALTVELANPISVGGSEPVILVDQAPITVKAASLPAGLNASLTLTFAKAGSQQVTVPIVDGNNSTYATVQPSAPADNG